MLVKWSLGVTEITDYRTFFLSHDFFLTIVFLSEPIYSIHTIFLLFPSIKLMY